MLSLYGSDRLCTAPDPDPTGCVQFRIRIRPVVYSSGSGSDRLCTVPDPDLTGGVQFRIRIRPLVYSSGSDQLCTVPDPDTRYTTSGSQKFIRILKKIQFINYMVFVYHSKCLQPGLKPVQLMVLVSLGI